MRLVCSPLFSVGMFVFLCLVLVLVVLVNSKRDMDAQKQNGFHEVAVLLVDDFAALIGRQVWLLFGQFWPDAAI